MQQTQKFETRILPDKIDNGEHDELKTDCIDCGY